MVTGQGVADGMGVGVAWSAKRVAICVASALALVSSGDIGVSKGGFDWQAASNMLSEISTRKLSLSLACWRLVML